jgi:hypothetical protein
LQDGGGESDESGPSAFTCCPDVSPSLLDERLEPVQQALQAELEELLGGWGEGVVVESGDERVQRGSLIGATEESGDGLADPDALMGRTGIRSAQEDE